MTDKLNIYVDAKDLNDLTVLAKRAKEAKEILDNMHDYQMNYFTSQLKTFKEVLEYIPQKDYEKYNSNLDYRIMLDTLQDSLKSISKSTGLKGFLIDVKRKKIYDVYYTFYDSFYFYHEPKFKFDKNFTRLIAIIEYTVPTGSRFKAERKKFFIEYRFDIQTNTFIEEVSYSEDHRILINLDDE